MRGVIEQWLRGTRVARGRYPTGGNANIFDGDRRISIIGLSNNVNQQNFAFEDLLSLMGGTVREPLDVYIERLKHCNLSASDR